MKRANHADVLGTVFDLVVVGGGITGASVARDAAARGFSVLLVEKDDFAAGTSSRSSKLIHGGLRYLETYQFHLVAEALKEREVSLRTAPHRAHVLPFLYLVYEGDPYPLRMLNFALTFYDVASGAWRQRRHRMLKPADISALEPEVRRQGLLGGALFYDVATDDSRLTLDVVTAAADLGCLVLNHAEVVDLIKSQTGKVTGVVVTDTLTGDRLAVGAKQVVNATGPWTDKLRQLESGVRAAGVRPAKGVHIALRTSDFPLVDHALFLRSPTDGRVVWPIPATEPGMVYVGTTDTDFAGSPDDVVPSEDDIDYLLAVANHALPDAHVDRSHIVGSWAGLRPLVPPSPGTDTDKTSREHRIDTGPGGMLSISGGKLTTARVMGAQVVDAAARLLRGRRVRRSDTARAPLLGADVGSFDSIRSLCRVAGVPAELAETWLRRFGSQASEVLRRWRADEQARKMLGESGLSRAELEYMVECEAVGTLQDLLVRRTSAFFWRADGGFDPAVVTALGDLLGWSDERRQAEEAGYRDLVATHRYA